MEERTTPENLQVSGRFPQWLSGVLYRIGPAKFSIPLDKPVNGEATYEIKHWFDGLAQGETASLIISGRWTELSVYILIQSK